jgi:hypothetical protein
MRRVWILAAALSACGGAEKRVEPRPGIDPAMARETVLTLVAAVGRGDREAVRRALSLADLARSTRPDNVSRITRNVEAAFAEEALNLILAPESPMRRILAGLEVREGSAQGEEVTVEAMGTAGPVRFLLGRREGQVQVIRIE